MRMTKIDKSDPTYKAWNDHMAKSGKTPEHIYIHRHLKQAYDILFLKY